MLVISSIRFSVYISFISYYDKTFMQNLILLDKSAVQAVLSIYPFLLQSENVNNIDVGRTVSKQVNKSVATSFAKTQS